MRDHDRIGPDPGPATATVVVGRVVGEELAEGPDLLAVEGPLAIRLGFEAEGRRVRRGVAVTMRTPGHDDELAVGFLFAEGIVREPGDVLAVRPCAGGDAVRVDLRAGAAVDLARLERGFAVSSSCGVCGKATLEAIRSAFPGRPEPGWPVVEATVIKGLPEALRSAQAVFDRTGGLHAAGLFDPDGRLVCLREDVGRHNALDKLIGARFLAGTMPLSGHVLLLSGRVSFELVQKAAMAGIPVVAAVGAPSSLAVSLADERGLTVVGFVRRDRFNIYAGGDRIAVAPVSEAAQVPVPR